MPKPPTDVLARWTVEASAWEAFVRTVRAHPLGRKLKLHDDSEAGRTVLVASDAIHVGDERIDLAHFHVHRAIAHGTWLQLEDNDPDTLPCPLPLPTGDAALAAWVVDHFQAIATRNTVESALRSQQAEAERNEPTPTNRLLWFVERHFVACLLGLLFVVLPLLSVLAAWIAGRLGADS